MNNSNHLKKVFDETVAETLYIRYGGIGNEVRNDAYEYIFELVEDFIAERIPVDFLVDELHDWSSLSDLEIANFIDELECIKEERQGD